MLHSTNKRHLSILTSIGLLRRGWSQETITPGMRLIVSGSPSRNGSKSIGWSSLTTTAGVEVGP